MDDEKHIKKKKKGIFGGILRAKSFASRAKEKVFRDRDNGSSSTEDKTKLKSKASRQVIEEISPVKVKQKTRKSALNGGDHSRRAYGDGSSGTPRRVDQENIPIPRKKSRTMKSVVQPIDNWPKSTRRRPRRPKPLEQEDEMDSPGARQKNRLETPEPPALTQWPPPGLSNEEDLPPPYAMELIARGAPVYKGYKRPIPHAPEHYYALYTTTSSANADDTDGASIHDSMTPLMTLRLQGTGRAYYAWETLEQPSCAFLYGERPGTITLNQWVSMSSSLPPTIALRDSGVVPRTMHLYRIMERLRELQAGLEDDDENLLYRILYKRILRDPDRILNPHRTLDKQITDLLLVLSRPDWIDFTEAKNQVVTRFIFNSEFVNPEVYRKFFHQLLLSLELDMRIHSRQHGEWAKEKLLGQIPPTIRWNLALARRWRENVRIDGFGGTAEQSMLGLGRCEFPPFSSLALPPPPDICFLNRGLLQLYALC